MSVSRPALALVSPILGTELGPEKLAPERAREAACPEPLLPPPSLDISHHGGEQKSGWTLNCLKGIQPEKNLNTLPEQRTQQFYVLHKPCDKLNRFYDMLPAKITKIALKS